jgi:hypothetical protein
MSPLLFPSWRSLTSLIVFIYLAWQLPRGSGNAFFNLAVCRVSSVSRENSGRLGYGGSSVLTCNGHEMPLATLLNDYLALFLILSQLSFGVECDRHSFIAEKMNNLAIHGSGGIVAVSCNSWVHFGCKKESFSAIFSPHFPEPKKRASNDIIH